MVPRTEPFSKTDAMPRMYSMPRTYAMLQADANAMEFCDSFLTAVRSSARGGVLRIQLCFLGCYESMAQSEEARAVAKTACEG